MRQHLLILAFLAASRTVAPAGETIADTVIAIVDDTVITRSEIEAESRAIQKRYGSGIQDPKELEKFLQELPGRVAQERVDRELLYAEFKERGYVLPRGALQEQITTTISAEAGGDRAAFERSLHEQGRSLDDFEKEATRSLCIDIMRDEVIRRRIHITPAQVLEYYRTHADEFVVVARLKLAAIMLRKKDGRYAADLDKAVARVATQLQQGEFAEASAEFSELPNANQGGDLGWMEESEVRGDFLRAVADLKPGEVAGPLDSEDGVFFLRLADRESGGTLPLDDALHRKVESTLRRQAEDKTLREFVDKLRTKFFVRTYFR